MCLILGPAGSGKTLLLKRLSACSRSSYKDLPGAPTTIPTVGTNLVNMSFGKRQEITVRELGGCMAPIWHNYYKDCHAILFVVDASNRCQVSAACVELLTVLTNDTLQSLPALLILNKVDLPDAMTRQEVESLIRLSEIIKNCTQTVTVIEASAKDGQGLESIAHWIQRNSKSS